MVQEILKERGKNYGSFETHANLSQTLYAVLLKHRHDLYPKEKQLPNYMKESLGMICHKLARIINGDPMYDDSWQDIAGYSQLVVDILQKETTLENTNKE